MIHLLFSHKILKNQHFRDIPPKIINKHHFDTPFDKTLKNQAFHHFSHHQKSSLFHPKIPQTLENKAVHRTQPKTPYLSKKLFIKTYPFITPKLFKTPVKSILFNHIKYTNSTTLSKS